MLDLSMKEFYAKQSLQVLHHKQELFTQPNDDHAYSNQQSMETHQFEF